MNMGGYFRPFFKMLEESNSDNNIAVTLEFVHKGRGSIFFGNTSKWLLLPNVHDLSELLQNTFVFCHKG